MPKVLVIALITIIAGMAVVAPVFAQTSAEPVLQPDGSYVIPGQDGGQPTEQQGNTEEQNKAISQQGFISGIAVGAAVGFIGGSIIAWFLKPGTLQAA